MRTFREFSDRYKKIYDYREELPYSGYRVDVFYRNANRRTIKGLILRLIYRKGQKYAGAGCLDHLHGCPHTCENG